MDLCSFFLFFISSLFLEFARGQSLKANDERTNHEQIEAQNQRQYSNATINEPKMIIIDTDAGSDDGVAIINLLQAEKFDANLKTILITTLLGNTDVDHVGQNVLKILKTVNRLDIPVFRGSNNSLMSISNMIKYYGEDGFGDFAYPNVLPLQLIKKKHAVNALIETVLDHSGNITLVCLGPLTNIAIAMKLEPTFLTNLKEIFVLGGSDSGVGNVKPGVEYNFFIDPEAAYIVFKEAERVQKRINLVTWETVFKRTKVDMDWRKKVLGAIKNPMVDLINKAERLHLEEENWVSADTVMSTIVINNHIVIEASDYHIDVEPCGNFARGSMFIKYSEDKNTTKNVRLIKKIDVEAYKKMLIQNFSG